MDRVACGVMNFQNITCDWRGHLSHGLVGLDLAEGLMLLDVVPFLDVPLDNFPLGYSFSDVRKLELVGHNDYYLFSFVSFKEFFVGVIQLDGQPDNIQQNKRPHACRISIVDEKGSPSAV